MSSVEDALDEENLKKVCLFNIRIVTRSKQGRVKTFKGSLWVDPRTGQNEFRGGYCGNPKLPRMDIFMDYSSYPAKIRRKIDEEY